MKKGVFLWTFLKSGVWFAQLLFSANSQYPQMNINRSSILNIIKAGICYKHLSIGYLIMTSIYSIFSYMVQKFKFQLKDPTFA